MKYKQIILATALLLFVLLPGNIWGQEKKEAPEGKSDISLSQLPQGLNFRMMKRQWSLELEPNTNSNYLDSQSSPQSFMTLNVMEILLGFMVWAFQWNFNEFEMHECVNA